MPAAQSSGFEAGQGTPSSSCRALAADLSNSWAALQYYTCAAAVGADSPYLDYRFDETSGSTATDSSGNNRNGTFRGTGTTGGAARACARDTGAAITLSGAGYVSTPTLNPTPPLTFTVEIWFRTTTGAGGKLMGVGSSQTGSSVNADRHLYMTNAGGIVFGVNPGTVRTITSPAAYNDGAWHHAAASLSAAGIVLYLDGQGVASDATVSTAATAAGYWRIGYDNLTGCPSAPSSSYIAATLDDAAVYSTALTATKISAHHAAGR